MRNARLCGHAQVTARRRAARAAANPPPKFYIEGEDAIVDYDAVGGIISTRGGKTFTIESSGNPGSQPFIQDVTLNGRKHAHNWISFNDIRTGGMMHFTLSSQPNRAWGSAVEDAPPSLSDEMTMAWLRARSRRTLVLGTSSRQL